MTANLFNRMLPLLHKAIPAGLAMKGLSKISPKLGSFIQNSLSAGYSTNLVLDYLRKRTSEDYHSEAGRTLRPDEVTSQQNFNPSDNKRALSTAVGLGAGLAGLMGGKQEQDQSRGIIPNEITQDQFQRPPMQLGGRQPLGITEQTQGIPSEGSTIVPPISPEQQMQSQKRTAAQKFGKHQQKKKMVDELYDMYQAGKYPPEQNQQLNAEDQALLQLIQQTLQM